MSSNKKAITDVKIKLIGVLEGFYQKDNVSLLSMHVYSFIFLEHLDFFNRYVKKTEYVTCFSMARGSLHLANPFSTTS